MEGLLMGFFIIVMACILTLIIIGLGNWSVHVSQVKDHTLEYGPGSFSDFVREFNKIEDWKVGRREQLSHEKTDSEIFASIIKFNGKGMIINNPISYFMVKIYYLRKTSYKKKYNKNLWREVP